MKENKYKIRYSELFYKEVSDVVRYIIHELGNDIAAENLVQLVEKEIKKRSEFPESFKCFKLEKEGEYKWYRINVNKYVIFYTVKDNVMTLSRFLYSKRNIEIII